MTSFQALKESIIAASGLSKDVLHICVGLSVFVVVAVALRKPLRSITPWLAVVGVATLGELLDMRDDLTGIGHWQWAASLHDLLYTVFWPTVLLLLAQRHRGSGE